MVDISIYYETFFVNNVWQVDNQICIFRLVIVGYYFKIVKIYVMNIEPIRVKITVDCWSPNPTLFCNTRLPNGQLYHHRITVYYVIHNTQLII